MGDDRTSWLMRSRRWIAVTWLLGVAMLLNVWFCDWRWKASASPRSPRCLLVLDHGDDPATASSSIRLVSGVFNHRRWPDGASVSSELVFLAGVVVPFALVATATTLLPGGISAARRHRGRCPNCRHILQPTGDEIVERCPECTWRPAR